MQLTLGSLFDGIGGFPLAGSRHEFMPVWASEIEPWPIKATEEHFPDMKHLGDITKVHGAKIEPVDVITFGSPCTRLSVAGKHDGFDITFKCTGKKDSPHEPYNNTIRATDKYQYIYNDICPICGEKLSETNESALFFHAIRIIREMRDATNGIYPRFIVWENVPGAFSSNQGADFRSVLEEIAETKVSMPPSGKWATAGMVRTKQVDIAWRVLDAQYWGVPQRRRRIFIVADLGGQCASEILFKPQGMPGNIKESRKTRQKTTRAIRGSIKTAIPINTQITARYNKLNKRPSKEVIFTQEVTCTGTDGPAYMLHKNPNTLVKPKPINATPEGISGTVSSKWAKGTGGPAGDEHYNLVITPDVAQCITTRIGCRYDAETETLIPVSTFDPYNNNLSEKCTSLGTNCGMSTGRSIVLRETTGTLRANAGAPKHESDWESLVLEKTDLIIEPRSQDGVCRIHTNGIVPTLNTAQGGQRQPCILTNISEDKNGTQSDEVNKSFTLNTTVTAIDCRNFYENEEISGTLQTKNSGGYSLNYQNPIRINYAVRRLTPLECLRLQGFPDDWLDIEGMSDTAKYQAVGNSIAIPVVEYIMSQIRAYADQK